MPPLKHNDEETLGIQVDPDERLVVVRQSWLNTFLDCPEKARRNAARLEVDPPNDASGIGTAMHAAVEYGVNGLIETGECVSLDDMLQVLHGTFDDLAEHGEGGVDMRWVKRSYKDAIAYGEDMVGRFFEKVYPYLDPIATEVGFKRVTIGQSDGWTVQVNGSIDYVDCNLGLVDWKSASRAYQAWEKRRWAVQPSVYLAALEADALGIGFHPPYVFNYFVFPDGGKLDVQIIPVTRVPAQTQWLTEQVVSIARMVDAVGFDQPWPMRDHHALCSPTWCPSWSGCKGRFLGDDPVDWSPTPVKFPVTNVTDPLTRARS